MRGIATPEETRALLLRARAAAPHASLRRLAAMTGIAKSTAARLLSEPQPADQPSVVASPAPAPARDAQTFSAPRAARTGPVMADQCLAPDERAARERSATAAAEALALWRNPRPMWTGETDPFANHPADRGLPGWVLPWHGR